LELGTAVFLATYFPKGLWSGLPSEVMDTENHVTYSWILEVPLAFQETFAELQAVGAASQIVLSVELL
nr:hypothetical protein [Tanacetum cinerariifolium]